MYVGQFETSGGVCWPWVIVVYSGGFLHEELLLEEASSGFWIEFKLGWSIHESLRFMVTHQTDKSVKQRVEYARDGCTDQPKG